MKTQQDSRKYNRKGKNIPGARCEFYDGVSGRLYDLEEKLETILGLVKAFHQAWRSASEDSGLIICGQDTQVDYEFALVFRGLMQSISRENEVLIEQTRSVEDVARTAYAGYF